jgi:hypothetical protein
MPRSVPCSVRLPHRCRVLFRLADDVPGVYNTRYPSKNAEQYVDEEVGATSTSHCDRKEGQPYREEVEKDRALRVVSKAQVSCCSGVLLCLKAFRH